MAKATKRSTSPRKRSGATARARAAAPAAKTVATPASDTTPGVAPAAPTNVPVKEGTLSVGAGSRPEPEAMKKRDLFDKVRARADGIKGRDVRAVLEAVLDELGGALDDGKTLKMEPLGTVKVQRVKQGDKADQVTCRIRRKKPATQAKDPLAKLAE